MKRITYTLALIVFTLLCFLNFKNLETRSFIFASFGDRPNLPVTPFDYSVEFPAHLITDTIDTGYEAGEIDTTAFDIIDNDISTLGRVLFFDEKLSALENISCSSCHLQANSFAETKDFSEGISALTTRNSMNLNDLAWTSHESFFWDMRETDMHTMISLPLKDENEIGAVMEDVEFKLSDTDYYPQLFTNAYGDATINEERIVDALVNFIKSMNTFNSKFDKQANINFKDFTEKENRGKELFQFNCTGCHTEGAGGGFFIDFPIGDENTHPIDLFPFKFNNGLITQANDDIGAGEWHTNPDFDHLFKVPTLRNIAVTGPYMHDGRFETLEDVLDHYSEGVEENEWTSFFIPGNGYDFTQSQKDDLIAFLHTLTDESFLTEARWSNPFENDLNVSNTSPINFEAIIHPNPMFEQAVINFENPQGYDVDLNIHSADGKLVHQTSSNMEQITLDKSIFASGTYFLEMTKNGEVNKQKLVVQ